MIRYLQVADIITLHTHLIQQSGGVLGIRYQEGLDSALALPKQTFDGIDLYPSLLEKAAILAYALICNHPFVDGNKRVGHAAMEIFLVLNGFEIIAPVDDQEQLILDVANGTTNQYDIYLWLNDRILPIQVELDNNNGG